MSRATNRGFLVVAICIALRSRDGLRADVAPDPLWGGENLTQKDRKQTKVAMVDEVVKLRLSRDTCNVDVVFTMKNTGSEAETMTVGFPYNYPGEMKNFKALVDGKGVEVRTPADRRFIDPEGERRRRSRTTYWQLWEMTFPPDTPVEIEVSYSSTLESKPYKLGERCAPGAFAVLTLCNREEHADLTHKLSGRTARYILRTGSLWSGLIGHCRIEVTFDGLTVDNLSVGGPHFEPKATEFSHDKIVWNLKDYEPKNNFFIGFTPELTRQEILPVLQNFAKQHPNDPGVTEMISWYLIAADRRGESDKMFLELLKHWESRIVIWGPESKSYPLLQKSVQLFQSMENVTVNADEQDRLSNAAEIASVVERIAKRLMEQAATARADQAESVKFYATRIQKLLSWCNKVNGID